MTMTGRAFVTAVGLVMVAFAVGVPGAGSTQERARPLYPTTHDIAACAKAQDQPVCLLRVLASGPSHFSYGSRPEFAARPELLALIEDPANTVEARMKAGPEDALDALSTVPMLKQREAVAAALAADKAGASPEDALRDIRELAPGLPAASMFLGQIVTASGAELRSRAYETVWHAYANKAATPGSKPSLALARAALTKWDETQGDQPEEESIYLPGLVEAYASLGDEAGARRAAARTDEPPAMANVRVLTALGRLDEAVTAAEALTPRDVPSDAGDNLDPTRRRLLLALLKTDRVDLVRRLSLARLTHAAGTGQQFSYYMADEEAESPLAVLVRVDGPEALASWAERFEAAGRSAKGYKAAALSRLAVESWVRAGRPERARAVAVEWSGRVDCGGPRRRGCREGVEQATSRQVERMLLWIGDYEAAVSRGPLNATDLVTFDVNNRRGLANVDAHLARFPDQVRMNELALQWCVEHSADRGLWEDARACLDRIVARLDRPPTPDEVELASRVRADRQCSPSDCPSPRNKAFDAAWHAAAAAFKAGEPALAHSFVVVAYDVSRGGRATTLDVMARHHIQAFAIAELQAAGRV